MQTHFFGPKLRGRCGFLQRPARRGGALSGWARAAQIANLAAVVVLAASCAILFEPKVGIAPLDDPEDLRWDDDGTPESLEGAVAQSIRYYRRLPEETMFRYGAEGYSPEEMIRALEHFLALAGHPEDFRERLLADYLLFESVAPGGENLFTGYFEPFIEGARVPSPPLDAPLLARPADLVEVHLERFGGGLPQRRIVGRLQAGQLLPYYSREEIQAQAALDGQVRVLAYVDEVDLFFLQVQGSGVVRLPDGEEMKVTYDGTNGHPYRSIGAELIRREEMTREEVTMQSLRGYLAAHPERVRPLLFANPSYIFFRRTEEGPLGNIEVPLTPGRSLALDHRLFPKGGLAYAEIEIPDREDPTRTRRMARFFLVQDTGGVINGHGRADVFWGAGEEAKWYAGHLKHPGRLFLLVAKKEALQATAGQQ
ncbi:MAG: murein transglycosylase A [SAR324 cluster bacterium]|nr:murein transglycosylase A [SAR324 cluster bacterium]